MADRKPLREYREGATRIPDLRGVERMAVDLTRFRPETSIRAHSSIVLYNDRRTQGENHETDHSAPGRGRVRRERRVGARRARAGATEFHSRILDRVPAGPVPGDPGRPRDD